MISPKDTESFMDFNREFYKAYIEVNLQREPEPIREEYYSGEHDYTMTVIPANYWGEYDDEPATVIVSEPVDPEKTCEEAIDDINDALNMWGQGTGNPGEAASLISAAIDKLNEVRRFFS